MEKPNEKQTENPHNIPEDVLEKLRAGVFTAKQRKYIYQIPLGFIPGLGPKAIEKLLSNFGTEIWRTLDRRLRTL